MKNKIIGFALAAILAISSLSGFVMTANAATADISVKGLEWTTANATTAVSDKGAELSITANNGNADTTFANAIDVKNKYVTLKVKATGEGRNRKATLALKGLDLEWQLLTDSSSVSSFKLYNSSAKNECKNNTALNDDYHDITVYAPEKGRVQVYLDGSSIGEVSGISTWGFTGISLTSNYSYAVSIASITISDTLKADTTVEPIAAQPYGNTDDEAGFVAEFTAETTVSSLTWYLKVNDKDYQKLTENGKLPTITAEGTVKIGLVVSGLEKSDFTADNLAAGYTVQ